MCKNESDITQGVIVQNLAEVDDEREDTHSCKSAVVEGITPRDSLASCLKTKCSSNPTSRYSRLPKKLLSLPHQSSCNSRIVTHHSPTSVSTCFVSEDFRSTPRKVSVAASGAVSSVYTGDDQCSSSLLASYPTPNSSSEPFFNPQARLGDVNPRQSKHGHSQAHNGGSRLHQTKGTSRSSHVTCAFCRYMKSMFPEENEGFKSGVNSCLYVGIHSPGCPAASGTQNPSILNIMPEIAQNGEDDTPESLYIDGCFPILDSAGLGNRF